MLAVDFSYQSYELRAQHSTIAQVIQIVEVVLRDVAQPYLDAQNAYY